MEIPFDGTYDQKTYRRALALIEKKTVGKTILRWLALIALVAALGAGIYDWVDRGARAEDLPRLARPVLTAVLLGYYYMSPAITRQVRTSRMFQGKESRRMNGFVDLEGIVVG